MAKKYLTPDFDVTVYEIKEEITVDEFLSGEPDIEGDWDGGLEV